MTFVAHDGTAYRCYTSPNGIVRHYLGCRHSTPRQAIAHTVPEYVSPTRSESPSYPSTAAGIASGGGLSEAPGILGGNVAPHPRSPDLPPVTGDQLGQ